MLERDRFLVERSNCLLAVYNGEPLGGTAATVHCAEKAGKNPKEIAAKAKAVKYAKILAKNIINPEGDGTDRGKNAYFYDAAEGLLAAVVLMLAELLPARGQPVSRTDDIAARRSQGEVACGFGADSLRSENEFYYVHGAVQAECFSGYGAGAGHLHRWKYRCGAFCKRKVGHLPDSPGRRCHKEFCCQPDDSESCKRTVRCGE